MFAVKVVMPTLAVGNEDGGVDDHDGAASYSLPLWTLIIRFALHF